MPKAKPKATRPALPSHENAPLWCWSRVHKGMDRIHIIPRNRFLNIYIHRFNGPDRDMFLHDHPWWSLSLLLRGEIFEIKDAENPRRVRAPRFYIRSPRHAHRIVAGSWPHRRPHTLFITGPAMHKWGFHTDKGWVHHDDFLKTARGRRR